MTISTYYPEPIHMTVVMQVPLNTMIADLDEALRKLLRLELGRHGFDGVEVAFDAPTRDWAATVTGPTVDLFLHDLRESADHRPIEWQPHRGPDGTADARPPLLIDASYAVTAWTREVEDEHRLLSQVLTVLYAYSSLPADLQSGVLANGSSQSHMPLHTRVAQTRNDGKADFWSAVGGQYKASIDYVVTLPCDPGVLLERGPAVRNQTVRLQSRDHPRGSVTESHRVGGCVRAADGTPVADAWVAVEETGAWAVTDAEGRFRFDRVPAGRITCSARATDGSQGTATIDVPHERADVVLAARRSRARS